MPNVIVFGATSRMGYALAQFYLEQGCLVTGLGRRIELLESLKLKFPNSFEVLKLNVLEENSLDYCLEKVFKSSQEIDLVYNCIGTGELNKNLNIEIDEVVLQTNVLGATRISNIAYKKFKNQGFGHFVNISSIGGLRGSRIAPSYSASKAYQINYLESLYFKTKEDGFKNIFITDVRPGFVDTRMAKGEGLFWVADVQKVVRQITNAVKRKKRRVYVTKRWKLIAWLFKIVPSWFLKKIS